MRLALSVLCAFPSLALADTFTLPSAPHAATVFAQGAMVERRATLPLPAGTHQIVMPGLPKNLDVGALRAAVQGARLEATQFRHDAVLPQPDRDSAAIAAAKDRIEQAENALTDLDDAVANAQTAADAAEAKLGFLDDLGSNEGLPTDVSNLRNLAQMIGEETQAARREMLAAKTEVRTLNTGRRDLEDALADAKAALAALTPPAKTGAQLTLTVTTADDAEVAVDLTYFAQASWYPVYDLHLTGKDTPELAIKRGAMVSQSSGENWADVELTLSTFNLVSRTEPSQVRPIRRRIVDNAPGRAKSVSRYADTALLAEPIVEAPVIAEASTAQVSFDGAGVSYNAPSPVSVASGVDAVRIAFDTLDFPAKRTARAAPRFDETAFLIADFTNTTGEPLLESPDATLFLDGTMIGRTYFAQVPAGAEAELPFGAIEDLRLSYTVLNENEGDRGIISRSNAKSERIRMDVENIGGEDWIVQMQAAVPYSTQEDLSIEWAATPAPSTENLDDLRGVLEWDLDVPAGGKTAVVIEQDLEWPEDKVLR